MLIKIEAVVFSGSNYGDIDEFMGNPRKTTREWGPFKIHNSTGVQRAYAGDVIIKLKDGEFHILNNPNFAEEYIEVIDEQEEEEKMKCGCGRDLGTADTNGRCQECYNREQQTFGFSGWTCPRCGSVYGPYINECGRCNKPNYEITCKIGAITT